MLTSRQRYQKEKTVIRKESRMGAIYSFNRYELKYIVNHRHVANLWDDMNGRLTNDPNAGPDGAYKISSLYYDSPDLLCYWEKVDGQKIRRKIRLRTYFDSNEQTGEKSFLEIKQRINRTVQKRRVDFELEDALDFMRTGKSFADGVRSGVMDEIVYLRHTYQLTPTLIVSYKRKAFYGLYDDGLRITLDYHVKCREEDLDLTHGEGGHYILAPEWVVMEIKINDKMPLWLSLLLGRHNIASLRLSKYCRGVETAIRRIA
ncbi:polyphosphate polymerase domain-containing protein [Desulfococcaceae bacterium HSG7]|nr:polyphosphate polymerase domain-containing protein [Desulfococcaceae bacterium HSG7]